MTTKSFKCEICKDLEWIINEDTNEARPCICKAQREHERRIEASGIAEAFKSKTFRNFVVETEAQEKLKNKCMEYITSGDYKTHSLCLLGNVGSGKTHLAMAIANNLLAKGVEVVYIDFRSFMTNLKQSMVEKDTYQYEIQKAIQADILFIDDLYKGKLTKTDPSIMFEILNTRKLAMRPYILTSEMSIEEIKDVDEGVGSRIYEDCKGYVLMSLGEDMRMRRKP